MKDREFGYNAAKEFNELPGSEFHMSEDASKARKIFTRKAAARVAAAMLTAVVVADSFGMDILGGEEKVQPVPAEPAPVTEIVSEQPAPAEPAEVAEPAEPEVDPNAPVLYELVPEYMNFLANLYQACKSEDESSVGILLQEVPEGFPEMTVYYDGEHAQDRMVEGVPSLRFSLSSYSQDGSVPYVTVFSRAGFYFNGKVEEGCRVVLGNYQGTVSYWQDVPNISSYTGFASLRDIEGLKGMDTFHATGFATLIQYEKAKYYEDRLIADSRGTYVINDGRGFFEDGDLTVTWTELSYNENGSVSRNENGSVSTQVSGGYIQDKGKFTVEEYTGGNPRNIRVNGSKNYQVIDEEDYPDPYYHSTYQELYYLTDIYEELHDEWSRH